MTTEDNDPIVGNIGEIVATDGTRYDATYGCSGNTHTYALTLKDSGDGCHAIIWVQGDKVEEAYAEDWCRPGAYEQLKALVRKHRGLSDLSFE